MLTMDCLIPDAQPTAAVFLILGGEASQAIRAGLSGSGVALFTLQGMAWNDLSPWPAPPVFGNEPFTGRAEEVLTDVLLAVSQAEAALTARGYAMPDTRILCGYSLAGLFSLWSGCVTDRFTHVASVSGSLWFDGFTQWLADHAAACHPRTVYLSVGDKEKHTRNPRMACVEIAMQQCAGLLQSQGISVIQQYNRGGHFNQPEERLLTAIRCLIDPAHQP